jgi:chloramphenicol 3-O-phosphotransferase
VGRIRRPAPATQPDLELSSWRAERLRESGFTRAQARRIAADARYDLHALLELIDRGCSPELAAQIVAPLEEHRG